MLGIVLLMMFASWTACSRPDIRLPNPEIKDPFWLIPDGQVPTEPTLELVALESARPSGDYPVGWPGPNPDIHRQAIFRAILGPISQLGEYSRGGWSISFDELRVDLHSSRWLQSPGGELLLELHLNQLAKLDFTVKTGDTELFWRSPELSIVHLIPIFPVKEVPPPATVSLLEVKAIRAGDVSPVVWRWTR